MPPKSARITLFISFLKCVILVTYSFVSNSDWRACFSDGYALSCTASWTPAEYTTEDFSPLCFKQCDFFVTGYVDPSCSHYNCGTCPAYTADNGDCQCSASVSNKDLCKSWLTSGFFLLIVAVLHFFMQVYYWLAYNNVDPLGDTYEEVLSRRWLMFCGRLTIIHVPQYCIYSLLEGFCGSIIVVIGLWPCEVFCGKSGQELALVYKQIYLMCAVIVFEFMKLNIYCALKPLLRKGKYENSNLSIWYRICTSVCEFLRPDYFFLFSELMIYQLAILLYACITAYPWYYWSPAKVAELSKEPLAEADEVAIEMK